MNTVHNACRHAASGLCGLLLMLPIATIASASAGFQVAVTLAPTSQGLCWSEPLSGPADFQVTCTSGHFMNMSPPPNRFFVGKNGSGFSFHMGRGLAPGPTATAAKAPPMREPPATVSAMRVSSGSESTGGPVEILVSF